MRKIIIGALALFLLALPAAAQPWSRTTKELALASAVTTAGASSTSGVDTAGSTAIMFHVSSAASAISVAFQESIDGATWYSPVTVTTSTVAGEMWVCPAARYARFYVNSKAADGALAGYITYRSGPAVDGCHRLENYGGLTFAASTGVISVAAGKTAAISNGLTFAGTDSTTMTFPTTSATVARTDAANTFTGNQTVSTNLLANHVLGLGTAPTVTGGSSTCGTTAAAVAGKDTGGKVTVGSVGGTSCVVTFGTAFTTNAPACTASSAAGTALTVSSTITTLTVAATFGANEVFSYVCVGY
jgi:hypothetical protein